MSSIDKRVRDGKLSWRVRYRDPQGKQRNKSFARKVDASAFAATVETSKLTGSYVAPSAGKVTVGGLAAVWLDTKVALKPSTRERYAGILRTHVLPRWGNVKLADVSHSAVQAWVAELSQQAAAATVRKTYRVLSLVLAAAVKDGKLARNPATEVELPVIRSAERMYLTHAQVHQLAAACGPYRLLVLFLAYTGLRWGEMAALRVGRLDLMRRRVYVKESVTLVNGKQVWGSPKTHEDRQVPIPRFLVDELAAHVAGKGQDDLVFSGGRKGGALRALVFRRAALDAAAASIGFAGFHPHAFRHTAASLAIAAGADIKVVQQMLGHKSATMTLDLYGHLLPDRLDEVADRLDAAAQPHVSRMCPTAPVVELGKRRAAL
jgi:integrase